MATDRPATFDHLSKKKPMRVVVPIYLDDDALKVHTEAVEALTAEQSKLKALGADNAKPRPALQAAVDKAAQALEESTVRCTFESIGRKAYDRLIAEYPPSEKENEEHQAEHQAPAPYAAEPFSVALISASCIEPQMTPDQVRELQETWNTAEYVELFVAALSVNTQRRVVSSGNVYG